MVPETFYVPTEDGWRLAVHYFAADGGARRHHPVLMVHGLGANRLHFDLDERYSLARAACDRGYDVYVLELRGSGLSQAPHGRNRMLYQWGFGEFAELDMPAAIDAVLVHANATAFHGVGHSMGGMLLYATATTTRGERLRCIAAVASPLAEALDRAIGGRERRLVQFGTKLAPTTGQTRMPLRRMLRAAGRFIPLTARLKDGIFLNLANVEPSISERMAREAIHDVPIKLLKEITQALSSRNGARGPFTYEARLVDITVPVLAIGGCMDRVAPPAAVAAATQRIGSDDVRYREMGMRYGDRADYGHVDLLVGRRAPDEVYPLVLDFLDEAD